MLPPHLYPHPFHIRDFYFVPQSWLGTVTKTSELDVGEALLSMLRYDSMLDAHVVMKHSVVDQTYWTSSETALSLPPLCSRPTYSEGRKLLLDAAHLLVVYKQAQGLAPLQYVARELQAGIRYRLIERPNVVEELIYAPRGHMQFRWPAWLGSRLPGSRAARLALCALMCRSPNPLAPAAWSRDEIIVTAQRLLHRLTNEEIHATDRLTEEGISKGLNYLEALGAVHANGKRYRLVLNTFVHRPSCTPLRLSHLLDHRDDLSIVPTLLDMVANLVNDRYLPMSEFDSFVNRLSKKQRGSHWFLVPEDCEHFVEFVANRRNRFYRKEQSGQKKTPPELSQLLEDYVANVGAAGRRFASEPFDLRLALDSQSKRELVGHNIHLKAPDHRRPQTIQLIVMLSSGGALTPTAARNLLVNYWLVADQIQFHQDEPQRVFVALPLSKGLPDNLHLNKPFIIDANRLNTGMDSILLRQLSPALDVGRNARLDFSKPFQLLFMPSPEDGVTYQSDKESPKLDLHGRVVAYYPKTT